MNTVHLDTTCGIGLGDHLCLASLFNSTGEHITVKTDNRDGIYDALVRIKNILNLQNYSVVHTTANGTFHGAQWSKLPAPYAHPTQVTVKGKTIPVKDYTRAKRTIALCCYNGTDVYIDNNWNLIRDKDKNEGSRKEYLPQCKWRPLDYYAELFKFIRKCGYDVITIDNHEDLELKVQTLVESCVAVIGYEGGIAHLCHMLQIPYFMLQWQTPNYDAQMKWMQVEMLHQSSTTYIMEDDELFSLGRHEFGGLIERVARGGGNNRLLTGKIKLSWVRGINDDILFLDGQDNTVLLQVKGTGISDSAAKFVHHHFPYTFPNVPKEV